MPQIDIRTEIDSKIGIVFDLSRSIDLHQQSLSDTNEKAIAGRITGLIELNETVTWEAKHFGFRFNLTSKITELQKPNMFVDEMVKGPFKSFKHTHLFEEKNNLVIMHDKFEYLSPAGILGSFVDRIILESYMRELLVKRNEEIKKCSESDCWKKYL
ncbi:MAG: cell division protein [Ignavibacteriae bacterium HGW-Ignavibacteriae-4]|jgi:ligand-binding SRPBCC domain-containing protein|nr:MAG: cell division protein [Ignavibacteriae bacterium HGW-Ignavibacteriae-4]